MQFNISHNSLVVERHADANVPQTSCYSHHVFVCATQVCIPLSAQKLMVWMTCRLVGMRHCNLCKMQQLANVKFIVRLAAQMRKLQNCHDARTVTSTTACVLWHQSDEISMTQTIHAFNSKHSRHGSVCLTPYDNAYQARIKSIPTSPAH